MRETSTTQQIDSCSAAHLAHHVLVRTSIQSMIWHSIRRMHQGHTKLPVRSQGNLAFRRGQWDAPFAKMPQETILAWSGIQHSITDKAINQWRNRLNARVKANGKHLSIFVVMCLSITVNLS